ncbi:hypothetical protein DB346_15765 [Verrucomicrobia bacterium LW23]|nr:hypothetical protein DB346_15765 [Verrucomicrobia bacterium LW23]
MGGIAPASPVSLDTPNNSLGAADPYGRLRLWREIAEVDFGKDLRIPLRLEFSSAFQSESQYAGRNWHIPLFEARAFLKREKMLQATLVCGKTMFLARSRPQPGTYISLNKEWTGAVNGDTITISREDGWEVQYKNGLISQLRTDTGRIITWNRSGAQLADIREAGNVVLRLQPPNNGSRECVINDKVFVMGYEKRPLVESINGKNLISGFEAALSSLTWPDGGKELYSFEVQTTPPLTLTPAIKITDKNGATEQYTWNAATQSIISDGKWTYDIGAVTAEFGLPRVTRKNAAGATEFISVNNTKGTVELSTLDTGHTITSSFTSPGPLYGKMRKQEYLMKDGTRVQRLGIVYDELGRKLRETDAEGFTFVYERDKEGKILSRRMLPTTNEKVLKAFEAKERELTQAVTAAKTDYGRQAAVKALCFFYIMKMRLPDKTLSLVSQIKNKSLLFDIKLFAVNHDHNLSYIAKVEGYKKLLGEFPEHKDKLQWLITQSQQMIEAGL